MINECGGINIYELQGLILEQDYLILELMSRGGMSILYRVRRLSDNATVVMKVCEGDSQVACESLRNEALVLKQLKAFPVAGLIDVISIGRTPAIIMEYLEGTTLDNHMQRLGYCDIDMIVNTASCVCSVITHMHMMSPPFYYCDIKPSNIMVLKDGSQRLIDYGAALQYDSDGLQHGTWRKMGTVGFAAPEQMDSYARIDERTDIYGIGMLMEYMYGFFENRCTILENVIARCTCKEKTDRYRECPELLCDVLSLNNSTGIIKKMTIP